MNIAKTPENNRAAEYTRYEQTRKRLQQRWITDRDALLEEHTVACPFCQRALMPLTLGMDGLPWVSGDVWIRSRSKCGCLQEQAAIEQQRQIENNQARERRRRAWAWALQRAGLTGWLAKASFESYDTSTPKRATCLRLCKRYTDALLRDSLEDTPWLVLYGTYGTGKTHLAAAVVREALGNGWTNCYFRPWLSYLRRLMDSFDADAEEKTADVARELAAGRLVVIDDIDNDRASVSKSGFAETELFRAIDDRYRAGLPTVLTFNRHPLEMTPWLGKAGVDRVIHYSYVVEFEDVSYRSGQEWNDDATDTAE